MIAISILFYTHCKGSEIIFLFRSSHRYFWSLTGYPVIRPAGYPANEPDIRYKPNIHSYLFLFIPIHSYSFLFIPIHSYSFLFILIHIQLYFHVFILIHSYSFIFIHIHSYSFLFIHIQLLIHVFIHINLFIILFIIYLYSLFISY